LIDFIIFIIPSLDNILKWPLHGYYFQENMHYRNITIAPVKFPILFLRSLVVGIIICSRLYIMFAFLSGTLRGAGVNEIFLFY
ncbi:MAG TPA: hypothetical protein ACN46Y_00835, partial [Prochlorococcus sp.]